MPQPSYLTNYDDLATTEGMVTSQGSLSFNEWNMIAAFELSNGTWFYISNDDENAQAHIRTARDAHEANRPVEIVYWANPTINFNVLVNIGSPRLPPRVGIVVVGGELR